MTGTRTVIAIVIMICYLHIDVIAFFFIIYLIYKLLNLESAIQILQNPYENKSPLQYLSTQEESHSGGTSVEFYTNVTLLSTLMSQR